MTDPQQPGKPEAEKVSDLDPTVTRTEEKKADEVKPDLAKADAAKPDVAKAEQPKADVAKAVEPKAEPAKAVEPKADEAKADVAKAVEPKAEPAKVVEPAKAEPAKAVAAKAVEPKVEPAKVNEGTTRNDVPTPIPTPAGGRGIASSTGRPAGGKGKVLALSGAAVVVVLLLLAAFVWPGFLAGPGKPDGTAAAAAAALASKDPGQLDKISCHGPDGKPTASMLPPQALQLIQGATQAGPPHLTLDTQALAPVDLTLGAQGRSEKLPADVVLAVTHGKWCMNGISQRQ
jgi:hypothetical protein